MTVSSDSSSSPLKGKLHFIRFATHRMEGAIQLMQHANRSGSVCRIFATGGGAYKFETAITDKLRLSLVKFDEFSCLVRGLDFMLNHVPKECFRLRDAGGGRGHASGWKGAGVAEGESMDCVYEEGGAAGVAGAAGAAGRAGAAGQAGAAGGGERHGLLSSSPMKNTMPRLTSFWICWKRGSRLTMPLQLGSHLPHKAPWLQLKE